MRIRTIDATTIVDIADTDPLWEGQAPGWSCPGAVEQLENRPNEQNVLGLNRAVSGITCPAVQLFLPLREKATGIGIVCFPGGAFHHLAIDKEGYDVARWLNGLGIGCMVVKYRVGDPQLSPADRSEATRLRREQDRTNAMSAGVLDAQRAVRLARYHAAEWNLDPHKIGVMGFSAGGYLVVSTGTQWGEGRPDATDLVERASSRPDFLVPIYAAVREPQLAAVSAQTPPAFIVQACDDFLPVEGSVRLFQSLRQAKVPVEMHLYQQGGHGFGLGVKGGAVAGWPVAFAAWLNELY